MPIENNASFFRDLVAKGITPINITASFLRDTDDKHIMPRTTVLLHGDL